MTPTTAPNNELGWRYSEPKDKYTKLLLLHERGCAIIGCWGKGRGLIAWCPLPRRDKQIEEQLFGEQHGR